MRGDLCLSSPANSESGRGSTQYGRPPRGDARCRDSDGGQGRGVCCGTRGDRRLQKRTPVRRRGGASRRGVLAGALVVDLLTRESSKRVVARVEVDRRRRACSGRVGHAPRSEARAVGRSVRDRQDRVDRHARCRRSGRCRRVARSGRPHGCRRGRRSQGREVAHDIEAGELRERRGDVGGGGIEGVDVVQARRGNVRLGPAGRSRAFRVRKTTLNPLSHR